MTTQGRTVLVTGSARGIGAAIAGRFHSSGYNVVLVDALDQVAETAQSFDSEMRSVLPLIADVGSVNSIEAALAAAFAKFGAIDILINNAGISPKPNGVKTPVENMALDDWERVMAINLTGAFLFCRGCIPGMKAKGWGRIVNISSMAGRSRSQLAAAHYSASKAGMIGFSRTLAGELAPAGITVNCVAPGRVRSPMAAQHGEQLNIEAIKRIPVGRLGTVDEIASVAFFLASEEAGYITGATVDANGGEFMG